MASINFLSRSSSWLMSSAVQLLAVLALATACGNPGEDRALAGKLESAVDSAGAGKVVSLNEMLPGDWTRLVVFPAYTSNLVARETLGFDFDIEATPS